MAQSRQKQKQQKTYLTKKELNQFKEILLEKRREVLGDYVHITGMAQSASSARQSGEGSGFRTHLADQASDTYDQEMEYNLLDTERQQIREIDDALQRIEDQTYGICELTGKQISKQRLLAMPWARYSLEAQRRAEMGIFEG